MKPLPTTCPLASPDLEFGELTADAARKQAAAFPGLAYTPQEAETVRELIREIKEHAAMGFDHFRVERALSQQLTESLKAKGFWVRPVYTYYMDKVFISVDIHVSYHAYSFTVIGWGEAVYECRDNEWDTLEEAKEHARKRKIEEETEHRKNREEWERPWKEKERADIASSLGHHTKAAIAPQNGGCLILLCPLAILGSALYGIGSLFA